MKKIVSLVLLVVMSLCVLTGCWGSGKDETEWKKYLSNKGGGYAYYFDIDNISKYVINSHKNEIIVYNNTNTKNDYISFNDVYVDYNQYEGNVKISNSKGFSGLKADTINIYDGTTLCVKDNNCYIQCGRKIYMKNVKIKLTKVGQSAGVKGSANFSFDWA